MARVNVCGSCHSSDVAVDNETMKCKNCGSTGPFMFLDEKEASKMPVRKPIGVPQKPVSVPAHIDALVYVAAFIVVVLLIVLALGLF
ncbi:MAG: hypothetical protein HYS81_01460 [Candidatus Aenigmatarchaeota archaeon]|nr:MAG: hypothetical protein HYS81_01460 [Candidatus Aenigmarchaeota archaeon]